MKKHIGRNEELSRFEAQLRSTLMRHLNSRHDLLASFDPYSASKLLRYFLNYGENGSQATDIVKSLALVVLETIKSRTAAMAESQLSDPLIDIETKDVVDILRVYAIYAQARLSDHTPSVFEE